MKENWVEVTLIGACILLCIGAVAAAIVSSIHECDDGFKEKCRAWVYVSKMMQCTQYETVACEEGE